MQLANQNNRANRCSQSSPILPDLLKSILNVTFANAYFLKRTTTFTADQKDAVDLIHICKEENESYFTLEIHGFSTEICWFGFALFKNKKNATCIFFGKITKYGTHCSGNFQLPTPTHWTASLFPLLLSFMIKLNSLASVPSSLLLVGQGFGSHLESGGTL